MKTTLPILTLLLISMQAVSSVAFSTQVMVSPGNTQVRVSEIEKVTVLQKETYDSPAVRLVQTDNGGSSDVSSFISPSSLYLTIHRDGEMFDINGAYLLTASVSNLEVVSLDLKAGLLVIQFKTKNEQLKSIDRKMRISIKAALKETTGAVEGDFDNFEMKAQIAVETMRDL